MKNRLKAAGALAAAAIMLFAGVSAAAEDGRGTENAAAPMRGTGENAEPSDDLIWVQSAAENKKSYVGEALKPLTVTLSEMSGGTLPEADAALIREWSEYFLLTTADPNRAGEHLIWDTENEEDWKIVDQLVTDGKLTQEEYNALRQKGAAQAQQGNAFYEANKTTLDKYFVLFSTKATYIVENRPIELAEAQCYSITAIAHGCGTISRKGVFGVQAGEDVYYQISPDKGAKILRVLVDGTDIGTAANYTFAKVQTNHTIEVFFSGNRCNPQTGIY